MKEITKFYEASIYQWSHIYEHLGRSKFLELKELLDNIFKEIKAGNISSGKITIDYVEDDFSAVPKRKRVMSFNVSSIKKYDRNINQEVDNLLGKVLPQVGKRLKRLKKL